LGEGGKESCLEDSVVFDVVAQWIAETQTERLCVVVIVIDECFYIDSTVYTGKDCV